MKTLVQLVSDQTMQNLLPAMALRPERIVHLCTPRMQSVSEALVRAYKAAGVETEVHSVPLGEMPGLQDTAAALRGVFQDFKSPIVNFTGGTKLMSIGAYATASVAKVPSLYVDTTSGCFVDGETAPGLSELLPDGSLRLDSVMRRLSVSTIAIANGVERVTGGVPWSDLVPVARLLVADSRLEETCFRTALKWTETLPRDFNERRKWFKIVYSAPLSGLPDPVRNAAVSGGLFEKRNGLVFPRDKYANRLFGLPANARPWEIMPALDEAAFPLMFLQGPWWEVAVADYFARLGNCRDVRWSVHAGSRGSGSTDMEEDVLAVSGANLLYVSCKRGGQREKLSRFLEETESSARRLGGSFARKTFAVFLPQNGAPGARLRNRCKELHIDFLDGETVRRALP